MRDLRNPFRLQTAESIEADAEFLRLFGPAVLDLLPDNATNGRPLFIRSAPGGGKTTLLRVFSPSVLVTLLALRGSDPFREVFGKLRDLQIVDDNKLRVLGVMLSCRRTFPTLADLDLPAPRANRLLLALLDARIVLGALRGLLHVHGHRYPDDLDKVSVDDVVQDEPTPGLGLPCKGTEIRQWAEGVEQDVCAAIDSLGPSDHFASIPGHDALHSLRLLDRNAFKLKHKPTPERWLVLLDDVHRLTSSQRRVLRDTLLVQRSSTSTWIAERLEALSTDELLADGALEGRDYGDVITLEEAWSARKRFENAATAIAERRARIAVDVASGTWAIGSFEASLQAGLDAQGEAERVEAALRTVSERVERVAQSGARYGEWIRSREGVEGTSRERLIAMRTLEILIERDRRKSQLSMDFELSSEDLEKRGGSGVRGAAELFVATEFGFPYYFGPSYVAQLGSFNVEQFLRLAGDLFEESLGAALLRRDPTLAPRRQEKILLAAYEARISELPRRARNGRDVIKFLDATGRFCRDATYQPNAPYDPGVTGIAISMADRDYLLNPEHMEKSPAHRRFAEMLATALAQNVFRARLDYKVKGGKYMVLYLNRLACVKYRLPLQFGGFREKPLRDFISWLEKGYTSPRKKELAL